MSADKSIVAAASWASSVAKYFIGLILLLERFSEFKIGFYELPRIECNYIIAKKTNQLLQLRYNKVIIDINLDLFFEFFTKK